MHLDFLTFVLNILLAVGQSEQSCNCGIRNSRSRVIGGEVAKPNEWPWLVGIKDVIRSRPTCGGSLISVTWVLTAAHCLVKTKAFYVRVILGEHDLKDNEPISVEHSVKTLVPHEKYNSTSFLENDIGLIELKKPVAFTREIGPVCLPFNQKNLLQSGVRVTISGWGRTYEKGPKSSILLKTTVNRIPADKCRSYLYGYTNLGIKITENMFCAGKKGKDACQGDSGGPLISVDLGRYYQVGIVSFGHGCAKPKYPGVYTDVHKYLDWIKMKANTAFCNIH